MLSERDRAVDLAKGMGLLLVFVGHAVQNVPSPVARGIFQWIYAFHMPLFFFLAGFGLAPAIVRPRVSFGRSFVQIGRRLLVPYFAFGTAYLVMAGFPIPWTELALGNPHPGIVIWFLYALAAVRVGLLVMGPAIRAVGVPAAAALAMTAWIVLGHRFPSVQLYRYDLYLRPQPLLAFAAFVLAGAALRGPVEALLALEVPSKRRWFLAAALAVGVLFLAAANTYAPIFALGYFGNPAIVALSGLLGTAMTLTAATALRTTALGDFFAEVGRRSLGIFCLNGFTLAFLNGPVLDRFPSTTAAILFGVIQLLAATAVVDLYESARQRLRREKRVPVAEPLEAREPRTLVAEKAPEAG